MKNVNYILRWKTSLGEKIRNLEQVAFKMHVGYVNGDVEKRVRDVGLGLGEGSGNTDLRFVGTKVFKTRRLHVIVDGVDGGRATSEICFAYKFKMVK